ncbi:MAG: putative sporulation protein YtxC [Acetivibrionales bacterium]|jgi:putative sporulation protein YtxC
MQCLCIGVDGCAGSVKDHIENELKRLKCNRINFSVDEVNYEGVNSIICMINDNKLFKEKSAQSYNTLKMLVSNALGNYIVNQYEEKLLSRIINSNYCYFNSAERKEILCKAQNIIRNEDKNFFNSLFQIRRRNIIVRKLIEYFDNSNNLILEGFINFRLKEYMKDLEEIVDKAVDDFLMEREYREFIRLLRYFVDIQNPKFDKIHVIAGYDGKYILLDENGREITNECIQEFVNEISEGEINFDDLLVSSLITFAPKKVVIHCTGQMRNKELLETIKNVFYGRVFMCNGCEKCIVSMVKSENKK